MIDGIDYGPLAEWKDDKLHKLCPAVAPPPASVQQAAAIKAAHGATPALPLYICVRFSDFSSDKADPDPGVAPPVAVAPAGSKVLAGAYGGLFSFHACHTSIGSIYSLTCKADGSKGTDMSQMG